MRKRSHNYLSTIQCWGVNVPCSRTSKPNVSRISNPGSLDLESDALQLGHHAPMVKVLKQCEHSGIVAILSWRFGGLTLTTALFEKDTYRLLLRINTKTSFYCIHSKYPQFPPHFGQSNFQNKLCYLLFQQNTFVCHGQQFQFTQSFLFLMSKLSLGQICVYRKLSRSVVK